MRLLDALSHKNKGRPPIWLMRQAGRYMPEYQKLRRKISLTSLFRNSELIQEVTNLPLKCFDLDAGIIFSDILIALDGMGIHWDVVEGIGPVIEKPIDASYSFKRGEGGVAYAPLLDAIRSLKKSLKVPLIGFAGAPFTIASYLIEGKNPRECQKTKRWLYQDPKGFQKLLDDIASFISELLNLQVDAGVDALQIFDTHASALAPLEFEKFILPSHKKILDTIPKQIPTLIFTKHSAAFTDPLATLQPRGLSLDWSVSLSEIRKKHPSLVLQGNLDPMVLFGSKELIRKKAKALLQEMKGDPSFIFNLGHGILPETPPDNVRTLIDAVHGN